MRNLTIAVDDSLLRLAQDYAVKHGTTLSQIVQAHLVELTDFEKMKDVNQLEKRWPRDENEQVIVSKLRESNVSLSFKALEESDFPPSTSLAENGPSPFDTPELSSQQLDQKMAEMFTQALQRKNEG